MKNVPVKTKLFIGRTFKVLLLRARVRWQAPISFLCGPLRWPIGSGSWFCPCKLLGLGSLVLLYLGRLFNLLFFAATGFLTLRRLPFGKTAVFAVYLLPMNLHLVSSLSYDVLITAFCGYFTAVCMDLAIRRIG